MDHKGAATFNGTPGIPDGTGAPGFAAEVYLSLVRNHMRELNEIYGQNISQ